QMFMPLGMNPFLVVVAPCSDGNTVERSAVRAFISNGMQGVNYFRGVWHHPVIALQRSTDFLMIGRKGIDANCDSVDLQGGDELVVTVADTGALTSNIRR